MTRGRRALRAEAADHAARVALERQERARLDELGRPVYDLPLLSDGIDLGGLYELAGPAADAGCWHEPGP